MITAEGYQITALRPEQREPIGAAGCPVSVRRRYPEGGVDSTLGTPSESSKFPKKQKSCLVINSLYEFEVTTHEAQPTK